MTIKTFTEANCDCGTPAGYHTSDCAGHDTTLMVDWNMIAHTTTTCDEFRLPMVRDIPLRACPTNSIAVCADCEPA